MFKKYAIIQVMADGSKRLLTRALTAKTAFRLKADAIKRFGNDIIVVKEN